MDESSGPPTSQAIFWTTRYYTTLWDIPTSTLQDYFVTYVLVDNGQGWFRHHPFVIIPFGFKYPLILNSAVIRLDYPISHNNSTSYSYCSSELNPTTHIAESYFHFIYSVTLDYSGPMISRLPTRVNKTEVLKTAISFNLERPLYPTFVVYLSTIGGRLSFFSLLLKINPRVSLSNILTDKFVMLKNVSETYSITTDDEIWIPCFWFVLQTYDIVFRLSNNFVNFFWLW